MKIIISPAKKMNLDNDSFVSQDLPSLLHKTEILKEQLKSMDYNALKKLWRCNRNIADLNYHRLQTMDLERNLTPSIFAYEGIQYTYMAPHVFEKDALDYVQNHLCILSGFYGLLRPFDGIVPYRLEMQAKIKVEGAGNLYDFWGDSLAKILCRSSNVIVNLASGEYSRCISSHLPAGTKMLNCVFGENIQGMVKQKGTMCKMARGAMVRYMAERKVSSVEEMKNFQELGYRYANSLSNEDCYVFIKG